MPQDIVTKYLKEVCYALLYVEFVLVIDGKMLGLIFLVDFEVG